MGVDALKLNVGNLVSRNSYKNDIVFEIVSIHGQVVILRGVNVRLLADANIDDLQIVQNVDEDDDEVIERNIKDLTMNRSHYFYIPGKILHIDGDDTYLDRCMKFYQYMGIQDNGLTIPEKSISLKIQSLLEEYRPDIIVITGHDAYYAKKNQKEDSRNYQNSGYFISAIKEARKYEKSQDKLIIIAGACQSNYEELIKAGANFASSPKRINIHALDPAIIASSIALSDKNKSIDLIHLIEKTKYGSDGIGGIITNGTMYVGYPRCI